MLMPLSHANALTIGANLTVIDETGREYLAVVVDLGKVAERDEEEGHDVSKTLMAVVEARKEKWRGSFANWDQPWQRRILHANDDGVIDMWDIDHESDGGEDMQAVRTVLWRMS